MVAPSNQPSSTVERGERLYRERLRCILEPDHNGECVAIDVESGDYEVDPSALAALDRARVRRPSGRFFLGRVGQDAFVRIGARSMGPRS
jgi:hypothetical protein